MAETEPHVFISYVREDKAEVDRVHRLLEAAGIPVWRDTDSLWPGEDWRIRIRQAITANALAFIACFSDNSERKASTHHREELLLAIDQLRMRHPEQPWLIPVRFSNCPLPQYDLGGGRTLGSLQRADLFGDQWELQSARLIAAVLRVLPSDEAPGTTQRVSRLDPEGFVKRALLDSARQIELDDYVMDQANVIAAAFADQDLFPTISSRLTPDNDGLRFLVAEANRYWDTVEPLLRLLVPGCAWGKHHHEGIWTRAVERVANATGPHATGQNALIELQRFRLLGMLYAAGMAALHRRSFGTLRAVAVDATYRARYGAVPLVGAANVWRPFGSAELTPQLLALQVQGEALTDELIETLRTRSRGRLYTPVSDYLHHKLRPYLQDVIPDDTDYTSTFDRLEVLLGALAADAKLQAAGSDVYVDGPWFGSFTWRDRFSDVKIEDRMLAELKQHGHNSPMLEGGLFGGRVERAEAAFSTFAQGAESARQQRW